MILTVLKWRKCSALQRKRELDMDILKEKQLRYSRAMFKYRQET